MSLSSIRSQLSPWQLSLPVVVLLALLSSGCGSVTPLARSERAAVGFGLGLNYCLEPAASVQSDRMILGAAGSSDSPYGVGRMAGSQRSQEVAEIMLFARENLYRICEAHQNELLDPKAALGLWMQVITMARDLIAMRNRHETVLLAAGVRHDIERIDRQLGRAKCAAVQPKAKKEQCERRRGSLMQDKKRHQRLLDVIAPPLPMSAPNVRSPFIPPEKNAVPPAAAKEGAPTQPARPPGPFTPPGL